MGIWKHQTSSNNIIYIQSGNFVIQILETSLFSTTNFIQLLSVYRYSNEITTNNSTKNTPGKSIYYQHYSFYFNNKLPYKLHNIITIIQYTENLHYCIYYLFNLQKYIYFLLFCLNVLNINNCLSTYD